MAYHSELSERLKSLASSGDFPHILFYGPSGAGKKTRIMATLRELYGPGVEKLKIDQRVFVTPSNRKLDVNVVQSNYHIELTPSDVGMYDRVVIQDILKEIAQTQQVDFNAKQKFKVVVINEADSLSRDAQAALRRTMEKYMTNMRLIMCANSTSKIIAPIRSRCLLVRVAAPTDDEVAKKERFTLPPSASDAIIEAADGNLRKALLVMEAMRMQNPDLNGDVDVAKPDWELYCAKIAESIMQEQSPQRLLDIRGKIYELLSHCIPPAVVLKTIADGLVARVDDPLKPVVVHWAAHYGSKKIFHIEAFIAKIMKVVKEAHFMGVDF
ncbi:DNA clamp loader [Trichosporon asahii var. asahii CBS 8904]|uniref:Replication factor C subunit 5 n=1 Tax=Trichosporon asahii var. asahii (strain CBS 8904) TaxID=1220162 RepID=K1VW93_TRIAC|nr:DNA clamp loader [Trichosporon asahii var. asahii CBS 8904]